jgi:hypothetical protein
MFDNQFRVIARLRNDGGSYNMTFKRPGWCLPAMSAVITACVLSGCNKPQAAATDGDPQVVATVNGTPISMDDYYTVLQSYVPPRENSAFSDTAGSVVLTQMMENCLYEGLAKRENVDPTDDQLNAEYQDLKMLHDSQYVVPLEQDPDVTGLAGLTPDEYKEFRIKPQLAQINLLTKGLTVKDADIDAFYNQNKLSRFTESDRAHIFRVAFSTQAAAQAAYEQIKQRAATLDTFLPQSLIKDTHHGELMNWVPTDSTKDPQLAPLCKAILNTPVGQTSPPFQLQSAWWLVKVVDHEKSDTLPETSVRHLIGTILLNQQAQDPDRVASCRSDLRNFVSQATLTVSNPAYGAGPQGLNIPTRIKQALTAPDPSATPAPQ